MVPGMAEAVSHHQAQISLAPEQATKVDWRSRLLAIAWATSAVLATGIWCWFIARIAWGLIIG
jgi:hypothetical protein